VIENILNSYGRLIDKEQEVILDDKTKDFLDKIYFSLENASLEELIEIIHEDPEWIELSGFTSDRPVMNIGVYKKRYKGIIEALKI